jgi:hypothetical protein
MVILALSGHEGSAGSPARNHGRGCGTAREVKLQQDIRNMPLGRVFAKVKLLGDRRVAEAVGDEFQDLPFPDAQHVKGGRLGCTGQGLKMLFDHDGIKPQPPIVLLEPLGRTFHEVKSRASNQIDNDVRYQDLTGIRASRNPFGQMQRIPGQRAVMNFHFTDVDGVGEFQVKRLRCLAQRQGIS